MDIEETRVCELNMCLNPAYYGNRVSAEHNRKYIEDDISYSYTCERIHIRVSVDNRERYKMWAQWLKYLNNEIMYANTHYLVEQNSKFFQNYKLPRADVEVKPKTDAKFTVEEIKFQVDDSGALWNILTNSIYTDRFDFVRELIQNAIDAVLLKTYLNRTIELSYQSPRVWKCRDEVVIAYSQDEGVLLVQDTGVGMNESELSTYLFKTANSGYKQKEQREFVFPAIAKFGIGFVACLTKADNIQILTCTEDGNGLKAEIDDNQSLAFIERENNQKVQGTGILLKLRYKYLFSELKEYIDETFVYPSVSIKLINLDQMRRYETSMPTLEGTEWRFELDKIEARIITQHRRVMAEWRHSRKKRKEFEGYKPVVHRITNHEMGRVADYSYLVLQMDPNLKVGRVYKDSKICKESQGLIFVSTNYMDYEFGVEWRSVNAFIFAENRIRKNLLNYFIVDDDEDESDVISLDSLTDIEYEMSMLLETDEAVDYYEKNFRDASIESEMDTEKYFYDVIVQLKNDFYQFFSIGMEELEGIEEQYEVESKDRLRSSLSLPSEYQDEPFDFGASKLYQDGIKMKLDPQCIVPIGVGYVQANLTASARLELNITRHEVSQNQDMIEKWCDEVGKKIQRKVVENCIHIFKENELEFDMKSLLAERPGDGIMEKICYDNIKQIIRECEDGK